MTVATKLEVVGSAKDGGISAMLKQIRNETNDTEKAFHKLSAAQKENASVDDVFTKARLRRASDIARTETKEAEAKASARRAAVEAARAARDDAGAKGASASATDKLGGALKKASGFQEGFNKLVGLAGFAGLAVSAVAGLVSLFDASSSYGKALDRVNEGQERFNQLLADVKGGNRASELAKMGTFWGDIGRATDEANRLQQQYFELDAGMEDRKSAILQLQGKIALATKTIKENEGDIVFAGSGRIKLQAEIVENTRILIGLQDTQKIAEKELVGLSARIAEETDKTNIAMQAAGWATKEFDGFLKNAETTASKLADGVSKAFDNAPSWNPLGLFGTSSDDARKQREEDEKKREKERADSAKKGAGIASQRRSEEAALRREIDLQVIASEASNEYERKNLELAYRRRELLVDSKMSPKEAELRFKLIELEQEALKKGEAERIKGQDKSIIGLQRTLELEAAKTALQKEQLSLRHQLEDIENQRKEGGLTDENARISSELAKRISLQKESTHAIDEEVKRIERLGKAADRVSRPLAQMSGRLGNVSNFVSETTKLWSNYEKGQDSLGGTVASTTSLLGTTIAGWIKNKRTAAGVEALFETGAALASLETGDGKGAAGHFAAAAVFTAVAAGAGGGGGGGKGGGGSNSKPQNDNRVGGGSGFQAGSSRPEDKREVIIMQNNRGVIMGTPAQVARSLERQSRSLRGTGYSGQRWR